MGCPRAALLPPQPGRQAVTALSPRPLLASAVHSLIFPEWMLSPGSLQNILAGAAAGDPEAKLPLQREVLLPEDIPAWCEGLWQERAGKARQPVVAKLGPQQGHVRAGPTSGGSGSPGLGNCYQEPPHALPRSLLELPLHQKHCRLAGLVKRREAPC